VTALSNDPRQNWRDDSLVRAEVENPCSGLRKLISGNSSKSRPYQRADILSAIFILNLIPP